MFCIQPQPAHLVLYITVIKSCCCNILHATCGFLVARGAWHILEAFLSGSIQLHTMPAPARHACAALLVHMQVHAAAVGLQGTQHGALRGFSAQLLAQSAMELLCAAQHAACASLGGGGLTMRNCSQGRPCICKSSMAARTEQDPYPGLLPASWSQTTARFRRQWTQRSTSCTCMRVCSTPVVMFPRYHSLLPPLLFFPFSIVHPLLRPLLWTPC
jgi:hypothetical protein